MRIRYSQNADVLYIRLRDNAIEESDEIAKDIIADYDKDGNVIGIEILWASERVDIGQLVIQDFHKVMVEAGADT